MSRSAVLSVLPILFGFAGCTPVVMGQPVLPGPTVVLGGPAGATAPVASGPSYGPGEDQHWIQADDFFIAEKELDAPWMYVHLAKMRQAPSATTKGEGQFFQLEGAKDLWTSHFWQSRITDPREIAIGALLICFEGNMVQDVYSPPATKDSARQYAWFLGRVTDTSDLFKGYAKIDTYKCSTGALRTPLR
jgi:hypothetical protein